MAVEGCGRASTGAEDPDQCTQDVQCADNATHYRIYQRPDTGVSGEATFTHSICYNPTATPTSGEFWAHIPIPAITIHPQPPTTGIVNLHQIFTADLNGTTPTIEPATTIRLTAPLPQAQLAAPDGTTPIGHLQATPATITWNFDDKGATATGQGRWYTPYKDPLPTEHPNLYVGHTYHKTGTYQVTCTITWKGQIILPDGLPAPATITNHTTTHTHNLTIQEITPRLIK